MKKIKLLVSEHIYVLLLLPGLLFLTIFCIIPLGWMIAVSFFKNIPGGYMETAFTLENYKTLLFDSFYLNKVFYSTVKISSISTFYTLILGYFTSYFLVKSRYKKIKLLLVIVLSPLWITVVVRLFGLMIFLFRTEEMISSIFSKNIQLMGTELAVIIALVQIYIPYVVLVLMSVLERIDKSLEEVAQSLGANSFKVFFSITLPISLPGIISATILSFVLSMSSLVIPQMMGGGRSRMVGLMAYNWSMVMGNLPRAAAAAMIMILITILCIGLFMQFVRIFSPGRKLY